MNGLGCFFDGFQLVRRPGLRRYVVVPVLINVFVFVFLVGLSSAYFDNWMKIVGGWFPVWLSVFSWIIWVFALGLLIAINLFAFTFIANIIGSPFNSMLSVKVEEELTGFITDSVGSLWGIIPRTVARELSKLRFFLPKLLGLLIITFIPVLNIIAPFLWVFFGAWMMCFQYSDYAADNNNISFSELRSRISNRRFHALAFGVPIYFVMSVPFVNLLLMPVGVAGGTRFWVEHLR